MSTAEIQEAVSEYGRTLAVPGAEWWETVQVTPVIVEPGKFHVAAPLWTAEEGTSDLSVELWVTEIGPALYRPSLLNIHAL
jgi:hypothetical protein